MEGIKALLGTKVFENKKVSTHKISASVDLIVQVVGISQKYPYKYWLGKVKRSKKYYSEILGIVKKAKEMDSKYNKGGFITNQLTNRKK